jgi:hypothetical protein
MKDRAPEAGNSCSRSAAPEHRYCNAFRIGYNRAEFVIEFSQAYEDQAASENPIRVVTAPAYAKALGAMIQQTVAEYEAKHGTIPAPPPES